MSDKSKKRGPEEFLPCLASSITIGKRSITTRLLTGALRRVITIANVFGGPTYCLEESIDKYVRYTRLEQL